MPKPKAKAKIETPKKLPSIWNLLGRSIKSLRDNPKLLAIVAIVLLPSSLLTLLVGQSSAETTSFTTLGSVLMNIALIWAVIQLGKGRKVSIKEAYYEGTGAVVRFILTVVSLVVMMVPLVFGLTIAVTGILPPDAQPADRILLGTLALILAAPTVYWLVRYIFGLLIVCEEPVGPIAAIKRSGLLVKGRFWAVFGRLAFVGLILSIVGSLPLLASSALKSGGPVAAIVLQLAAGLVSLPILNLYLFGLYNSLA